MPGLDYRNDVQPDPGGVPIAAVFGRRDLMSYYDRSTPDRTLVKCRDCGGPADPRFGDHGGDCLPNSRIMRAAREDRTRGTDALSIIRKAALRSHRLSINELRPDFDRAGVRETSRGPAFAAACRRGWIEPDGHTPSTDPATKRHDVKTYRSLLHKAAS